MTQCGFKSKKPSHFLEICFVKTSASLGCSKQPITGFHPLASSQNPSRLLLFKVHFNIILWPKPRYNRWFIEKFVPWDFTRRMLVGCYRLWGKPNVPRLQLRRSGAWKLQSGLTLYIPCTVIVFMYVYVYVCVYIDTHTYIYIYIYIHIYTHIHIQTNAHVYSKWFRNCRLYPPVPCMHRVPHSKHPFDLNIWSNMSTSQNYKDPF
jgi:hypothetical protein